MINNEIIRSLNEIQNSIQRLSDSISSQTEIEVIQSSNKLVPARSTVAPEVAIKFLLQGIRDVDRLVRVLDKKTPMPHRTYNKEIVAALVFQSKTLTGILSAYILPLLEQIDNNKK